MPDLASEYVAARTVLLDALEALGSQREAIIVVGAQAVYLRTGDAGITGVAPYTTDADLALVPARLADEPHIETLLGEADFEQRGDPGVWWKTVDVAGEPTDVEVDIMVPERYALGGGRRSVRLPPHDKMVARKAIGLEGSVVDHDLIEITALAEGLDRIESAGADHSADGVGAAAEQLGDFPDRERDWCGVDGGGGHGSSMGSCRNGVAEHAPPHSLAHSRFLSRFSSLFESGGRTRSGRSSLGLPGS